MLSAGEVERMPLDRASLGRFGGTAAAKLCDRSSNGVAAIIDGVFQADDGEEG